MPDLKFTVLVRGVPATQSEALQESLTSCIQATARGFDHASEEDGNVLVECRVSKRAESHPRTDAVAAAEERAKAEPAPPVALAPEPEDPLEPGADAQDEPDGGLEPGADAEGESTEGA